LIGEADHKLAAPPEAACLWCALRINSLRKKGKYKPVKDRRRRCTHLTETKTKRLARQEMRTILRCFSAQTWGRRGFSCGIFPQSLSSIPIFSSLALNRKKKKCITLGRYVTKGFDVFKKLRKCPQSVLKVSGTLNTYLSIMIDKIIF